MHATATWTVLLVEDNPGDANLIRECGRDWSGVNLIHVPNAVQANRLIVRKSPFEDVTPPDLVLLDLRMPIYDGSLVLHAMREGAAHAHTPVIVFTSSRLPSDEARCRELGATDYIWKPADWIDWQTTITRIFRKHLRGFEA